MVLYHVQMGKLIFRFSRWQSDIFSKNGLNKKFGWGGRNTQTTRTNYKLHPQLCLHTIHTSREPDITNFHLQIRVSTLTTTEPSPSNHHLAALFSSTSSNVSGPLGNLNCPVVEEFCSRIKNSASSRILFNLFPTTRSY